MNRKASISDVPFIGAMMMVFIVSATVGFYLSQEFYNNPVIQADPTAANITQVSQDFYCGTPDNLGLAVFFGSVMVAVMLAFLFGQNAIFKAITIIMMILLNGVNIIYQMWGEEYFSSSAITNFTACMPKVQFIMEHFVLFALLSSALIIIALFYRGGSGREF